MKRSWLVVTAVPALSACAQNYALRFPDQAFATRPSQRVEINILRGHTEVRGVLGSRDIVVRGTIVTRADSVGAAEVQAQKVRVVETSLPGQDGPVLRLEVTGIPSGSSTRFDAEFLVPRDVRLSIRDGPEDLAVLGVEGDVAIQDGAGDIIVEDFSGSVEIDDLDGDVFCSYGCAPPSSPERLQVRITDRRGNITVEDVTGDVEIVDREDDILIQSVTGDIALSEEGGGTVRINNLDGHLVIREWKNNHSKPIINTIWDEETRSARAARAVSRPGLPKGTPAAAAQGSPAPAAGPVLPKGSAAAAPQGSATRAAGPPRSGPAAAPPGSSASPQGSPAPAAARTDRPDALPKAAAGKDGP